MKASAQITGSTAARAHRPIRLAALVMLLVTLLLAAFATVSVISAGEAFRVPWIIPTVGFMVTGAVIIVNLPRHPIGWIFAAIALLSAVGYGAIGLAWTVKGAGGDPALVGWLDAGGNLLSTVAITVGVPSSLLLFPNGRLPSRRWKWLLVMIGLAGLVGGTAAILNGGWGGDVDQAIEVSPLFARAAPVGEILSVVFFPLLSGSVVSAGVSLILRFRRATGEQRQQLKWLALAATFLIAAFGFVSTVAGSTAVTETWQIILVAAGFAGVPASVAVAVLKYRLYDIDVVISKTFVFLILAVVITGIYVTVVVGAGRILGAGSDNLVLAIVATAVAAVVFEPVRARVQHWANRLVYGDRATPYEVLSDLTERLAGTGPTEGVLERMAHLMAEGTGAERAVVWLTERGGLRPAASVPENPRPRPVVSRGELDGAVYSVYHEGDEVGALQVIKPRGSSLTTTEHGLLADLAGSAGLLLGNQRLNAELARRADELAASRKRLVEAQDEERRRLERDLHDGAQQQVVALKVQISLARHAAEREQVPEVAQVLDSLTADTQLAVEELRAVAGGIYPPLLESEGLAVAVRAQAESRGLQIEMDTNVGRYSREVESTVYFCISRMLGRVGGANGSVRVDITDAEEVLHFEVGASNGVAVLDSEERLSDMADRVRALGGDLELFGEASSHRLVGWVPIDSG